MYFKLQCLWTSFYGVENCFCYGLVLFFQSSPQTQSALAFYNFFTNYAILGYCNPILSIFLHHKSTAHRSNFSSYHWIYFPEVFDPEQLANAVQGITIWLVVLLPTFCKPFTQLEAYYVMLCNTSHLRLVKFYLTWIDGIF